MSLERLQPRHAPPSRLGSHFNLLLGIFGLLAVIAFMADLFVAGRGGKNSSGYLVDVPTDLQNLVLGLTGPRYVDRSGLFTIVPPAGWNRTTAPDCNPYNVVFSSMCGPDISIMASRVSYNDLPTLFKEIEGSEKEYGIRTQVETIRFLGRPAVLRTCDALNSKIFSIDFVDNYVAHHILCGVPPPYYDKYRPVLMSVLETYEPLSPPAPAGSAAAKGTR